MNRRLTRGWLIQQTLRSHVTVDDIVDNGMATDAMKESPSELAWV
ncbi:MAG: hypothetical protein AAGA75_06640 [Cyanobacteria bacterium P01_E01_bin.6]